MGMLTGHAEGYFLRSSGNGWRGRDPGGLRNIRRFKLGFFIIPDGGNHTLGGPQGNPDVPYSRILLSHSLRIANNSTVRREFTQAFPIISCWKRELILESLMSGTFAGSLSSHDHW